MLRLPDVSTRYGAPMGRPTAPDLDTSAPVVLWPVALDSGGYDSGGAYWGSGETLWAAVDREGDMQFTRAPTRCEAVRRLRLESWRSPLDSEIRAHFDLDAMLASYLETALWATSDEGGTPLNLTYDADDLAPEFIEESRQDCESFMLHNAADLAASGLDASQIGLNFWLTREGHGAGFWDLGLGDTGDRLTESAETFGSVDLMPGDQLPIREADED